jgi:hypothetical protein
VVESLAAATHVGGSPTRKSGSPRHDQLAGAAAQAADEVIHPSDNDVLNHNGRRGIRTRPSPQVRAGLLAGTRRSDAWDDAPHSNWLASFG